MYSLSHQDPVLTTAVATTKTAVSGTKVPGANGELRHSLDRRRTASYRLSCISEHQKENTRSSEDEYYLSSAQAVKTPTLQPVRWPRRHQQVSGKSQSSGDGSAINAFQLDPEQIDGPWGQDIDHHRRVVLSAWHSAATLGSKDQPENAQYEAPATQPRGLISPGGFEVQWHIIRWTDAQPGNVYIKGHKRAVSCAGFDGSRSSTGRTSPLYSPNSPSSPSLGPLLLGNCIPCKPRRLKSETSSSEKSAPERKPRKIHSMSESSDVNPSAHKQSNDASLISEEKNNAGLSKRTEQDDQSKFGNTQENALKSCPELYRRSFNVVRSSISRYATERVSGLRPPNYAQFDSSRHQHRHRIQQTLSKGLHSIRERLRRPRSSSMFSVRPEFPPPPDGKIRRYRSRNSNEILPSSEESPIFNTPESNKSPVQPPGQNAALLAATGLRLAAVELDRLTNKSRSAKSSLEVTRISSGTDSARSGSDSSVVDTTPAVPTNSPSSMLSPGPISRPPTRPGQRARRQRSRLSEVTTPEEIHGSTQIVGSWPTSPQALYFPSDPLQDILPAFKAECDVSLIPRPPSIPPPLSPHGESTGKPSLSSESVTTELPLDHADSLETVMGQGVTPPERTSSPCSDQTNWSNEGQIGESAMNLRRSVWRPPLVSSRSEPNYYRILPIGIARKEIAAKEPAVPTGPVEHQDEAKSHGVLKQYEAKSCHPDTWSPNQGEPGDSAPFCPPTCASSKQCGHEI
ncbi:hypothetical protein F5Y01DRAFT_324659 [Xylaria sp. FL0043]|nr:hypothetical protein F5Y01DRAFT_324659 [Xylaria sp. FL0043]